MKLCTRMCVYFRGCVRRCVRQCVRVFCCRHETPVLAHDIVILHLDEELVVLDKPCSLPVSVCVCVCLRACVFACVCVCVFSLTIATL